MALKIQIIIIITPYVAKWIDLGIIILSEVRKRKPNVIGYHLYVECKKIIQMNLFIKQNRLTGTENKLMVSKGERWKGEINWEFGINVFTLVYIQ